MAEKKLRICDFCDENVASIKCGVCKKDVCRNCQTDFIFKFNISKKYPPGENPRKTSSAFKLQKGTLISALPQKYDNENHNHKEVNILNYSVAYCKQHGDVFEESIVKNWDLTKKGNKTFLSKIGDLLIKQIMLKNLRDEENES